MLINHDTGLSVACVVNSVNHTAINRQINYGYDSAGNIVSVTYANGSNQAVNNTYVYDELNQLIRENNSDLNQTITYSYDGGGNILTKTVYPYTTGSLDGLNGTAVNYAYTNNEWKDLLTSYNGNTITYDAIGNPLVYKNGELLTWQNGRRLASLTGADGTALTFKYNENGIRTQKTVNGTVTEYFLNGSTIVAQKTGNNVMWYYYDSTGTREAVEYNGSVYYYYYNAQGDVLGLIDEDLNVVVEYTYDSWGRVISISGSLAGTLGQDNPFRYRGYYYDSETGLYYLNSRYYDPEVGRFINADSRLNTSLGVLGCNIFVYCVNNPANKVDYGGNKPGDLFDTLDEAARDAAIYLGKLSFKNGWEYGTNIYAVKISTIKVLGIGWLKFPDFLMPYLKISIETKNKYSYTIPTTKEDPWSVSYDQKMMNFRVATLHTHPMGSGRGITRFSSKDKENAKKRGAYSYVHGPNGQVLRYDPWSGEDVLIFEDLPPSINKPWLE